MWSNFCYTFGRAIRETGQAIERVGLVQADNTAFRTFLNRKPYYKLFILTRLIVFFLN